MEGSHDTPSENVEAAAVTTAIPPFPALPVAPSLISEPEALPTASTSSPTGSHASLTSASSSNITPTTSPPSLLRTTQASITSNPVPISANPASVNLPTTVQASTTASDPTPIPLAPSSTSDPVSTEVTPGSGSVSAPDVFAPDVSASNVSASNVSAPDVSNPAVPAGQLQNQNHLTQRAGKKPTRAKLLAWKAPVFALVIVSLVDSLTLSATSITSPLGSVSYTNGVLILSIFSTLTAYSLSAATQTAWDRSRFRMFAKEHVPSQSLVVFWTMTAGVWGSCLILWRELCNLFPSRTDANSPRINAQIRTDVRSNARGHPKAWSSLRITSWLVVQFPGIIIMTLLNVETSYQTVQWTSIGGGIGIYDPKAAVPGAVPLLITNSALNILQDPTKSVQVDPVDNDCIEAGDSCESFLIPGGLDTVTPWPYQKLQDKSLNVYVTEGGPAYQIDFWSPPGNFTWTSDACSVYASSVDNGFQLCASSYAEGKTQIIAGWLPCSGNGLSSGECSQDGLLEAANFTLTILSISRRTATVYALRNTSTIVALENLGEPELQTITPTDFKSAFNVMLNPWTNSTSEIPSVCSTYQLTAQIASSLSLDLFASESTRPLNYLRNLFATPLYVFNPLVLGVVDGFYDIYTIQPDLLPENYINGSYARTIVHMVPQYWTVIAYVAVSGLLLLICFVALGAGVAYEGLEPSVFPFLDAVKLRWDIPSEGKVVENIREVFYDVDIFDDSEILKQAARVGVKVRNSM